MKHKSIWRIRNIIICLMILSVILLGAIFALDKTLFAVAAPFVAIINILGTVSLIFFQSSVRQMMHQLSREFGETRSKSLYDFPMPVLVCSGDGSILWYNNQFYIEIAKQKEMLGLKLEKLSGRPLDDFLSPNGIQLSYGGNEFRVYGTVSENIYTLYFSNNTALISIANEYKLSRPSVLLIMLDNYEEAFEGQKESVKSSILGLVDEKLESYFGQTNGFLRRLSHDRFLAVVERRHLDWMIENRFGVLNDVRNSTRERGVPLTLSIGVGSRAMTLGESETIARQSLDLALGRGGDQVAVKTQNGYDFYGGVSKGVERRTKVKTRVIATAIQEFIEKSDRILIMGHRFGDLDSMGSGIAMCSAARAVGKQAFVIVDYRKCMAAPLIDRMSEAGAQDMFIRAADALELVTPDTLLIITDTHNPDFLEAPGVYEKCKNVIVIDHHRKMVNYIGNALIFYHEPFASSASEMVTELVQYMSGVRIKIPEAEGLLAGIMLDTKNFVLKSGVRTFEAAAYLRGLGADMVSVRKLFSNSIEAYRKKTRIISNAETYQGCAVAIVDFQCEDMRMVASQAADELLNISDVDASFVIYSTDNTANISARSLGAVNTQLVMEKLGGGGHQSMAACQLANTSLHDARQQLMVAIDSYLREQTG